MKRSLLWITLFCLYLFNVSVSAKNAPPIYFEIEEAFTINFLQQSEQKARYLQVRVALRSQDASLMNRVPVHLPMLQDQLRILFSQQSLNVISTLEGRSQLQQQAFDVINDIFETELNNTNLDSVFFTTFLWQ